METAEALVLVGAVLVLFSVVYLCARNEIVRRRLVCPRTGATAEIELLRRYEEPRKPVRIKACSLFGDRGKVRCDQDCLPRAR